MKEEKEKEGGAWSGGGKIKRGLTLKPNCGFVLFVFFIAAAILISYKVLQSLCEILLTIMQQTTHSAEEHGGSLAAV